MFQLCDFGLFFPLQPLLPTSDRVIQCKYREEDWCHSGELNLMKALAEILLFIESM